MGDIAQFASRNPVDTGVRDITLFLGKSALAKKYEIALAFGTESIDE